MSNTEQEWQGVRIGDTSENLAGDLAYHGLTVFLKVLIAGDSLYFTSNYNQQRKLHYRAPLKSVQVPRPLLEKGGVSRYLAADDENVY